MIYFNMGYFFDFITPMWCGLQRSPRLNRGCARPITPAITLTITHPDVIIFIFYHTNLCDLRFGVIVTFTRGSRTQKYSVLFEWPKLILQDEIERMAFLKLL